ncbi:MAG TPA: AraC family transcriptional regulator [Clostridiaceae bacterium]|jgi:AraC-like DNA-binding protein/quercetin dioxygenase-like cupin family protein|nr:AraC family transcriptional regulator [Clostridiaceae bacterium]HBG38292.1 AraC family transcriptional regulator [Clostridiaceae bacterium]HBN28000.1 AraC family transcriptional regulator [Clostridiaceae bacterium]HBX48683.1 AraC family transcriptional regulator [Clostridiaceae bacterium]HCL49746.1 AraC family transcriptional regulator [Clostridiaceae bacterium]
MEAWFEKNVLEPDFPFRLFINEGSCPVAHHWHNEIEIIYMIEGSVKVGVNDKMYNLMKGDILLINSGDIHCFMPEYNQSNRIVIQFNLSIFDNIDSAISDKKEIRLLFDRSKRLSRYWDSDVKAEMEEQIKDIIREYNEKKEGYKLALKARLYDLVVLLIRKVPMEKRTYEDENRQIDTLNRLENVFQYVEKNYSLEISLEQAAFVAGYSIYHFTRFFKKNTGITFSQYLSNFRITKAEWELLNSNSNITEIAYKSGFNSIKTFNRVFKEVKGQTPSQYRKSKI